MFPYQQKCYLSSDPQGVCSFCLLLLLFIWYKAHDFPISCLKSWCTFQIPDDAPTFLTYSTPPHRALGGQELSSWSQGEGKGQAASIYLLTFKTLTTVETKDFLPRLLQSQQYTSFTNGFGFVLQWVIYSTMFTEYLNMPRTLIDSGDIAVTKANKISYPRDLGICSTWLVSGLTCLDSRIDNEPKYKPSGGITCFREKLNMGRR